MDHYLAEVSQAIGRVHTTKQQNVWNKIFPLDSSSVCAVCLDSEIPKRSEFMVRLFADFIHSLSTRLSRLADGLTRS